MGNLGAATGWGVVAAASLLAGAVAAVGMLGFVTGYLLS
jgi:hypothetical protein